MCTRTHEFKSVKCGMLKCQRDNNSNINKQHSMRTGTLRILCAALLIPALVLGYTLNDFKTQLFKFSYPPDGTPVVDPLGLYNIDFGFSALDDIQPLAFGDLNSDK